MGQRCSYMNAFALSNIVFVTKRMVSDIWFLYLQKYPERKEYMISRPELDVLARAVDLHETDVELLDNVFLCSDAAGFGLACVKNVLISFSMLLPLEPEDKTAFAMKLHSNDMNVDVIGKVQVINLLKLLNNSLTYFGDNKLNITQIDDLVDSVYTLRGKVDGEISQEDFITLMFQHPIVELALSVQFQGNSQWKNSN